VYRPRSGLPAATSRAAILILVLNVFIALFIDTIISEMLKQIFDIAIFGTLIWICGEASDSIVEEVDSHGMDSIKQNI